MAADEDVQAYYAIMKERLKGLGAFIIDERHAKAFLEDSAAYIKAREEHIKKNLENMKAHPEQTMYLLSLGGKIKERYNLDKNTDEVNADIWHKVYDVIENQKGKKKS